MFAWLGSAADAAAEPVNLSDGQARWIEVRFEISPQGRPGQRDTVYSSRLPAWLAPGEQPGQVQISIDSQIVEQHLMNDERPVPGSFSDFVWLLDATTGEVLSASLNGKLVREVGWGLIRANIETRIQVDMSTREQAGYRMPRRILRNTFFPFCGGSAKIVDDCTLVTPTPYQGRSGYVNAVGDLSVQSKLVTLHTFSPLGEAVFSEFSAVPNAEIELVRPGPSLEAEALGDPVTTLLGEASSY
jgi:hypothetical protein